MNIFIAKLSSQTTGDDLRELFENYGSVSSAKVVMDRDTGQSKRFGFVEMEDDGDGNGAIEALNETDFQNSKIVVKKSIPRERRDSNPRQRRY
ncbi:MAG: RNA-binding protein [Bacteroidetes bacterium]|jgi:RNA recognition motif-containing protein|nr:RNA-binding protein [Bacteroidota bacterium]MBT4401477.1 RNA-binding protein [Bacteroidota bacterium]MBT4411183.1 RNA-binding protein [Bacteroidota bacterium]MBT7095176.1 RNA-binding protein [Bacteroidota bacterium]MBT7463050.1 RNA-binding protein [Bacteroidota bacterium]